MVIAAQPIQVSYSRAFNLSLIKLGPIAYFIVGALVTALSIAATGTAIGVFINRVQYYPPNPQPDEVTIYKGEKIEIHVLRNDNDPKNDNLTVSAVAQPPFGKVEIANKQVLIYEAPPTYSGVVTFTYTCSNTKLTTDSIVKITILNHPPEAVNHKIIVSKNTQSKLNVINTKNFQGAKVYDPDIYDKLELVGVSKSQHGTATMDKETVYYTPYKDFTGDDELRYTITDGNDTSSGVIKYSVINNPPVANPDHFTVSMNKKHILNVLENDNDVNGDRLLIVAVEYSGTGILRATYDQRALEYFPPVGFYGKSESFEYTITDGIEFASTYGTVFVNNTPPIAESYFIIVPKNSQDYPIPLKYNDTDYGTTLTVKIMREPTRGSYQFFMDSQKTENYYYGNTSLEYVFNEYKLYYTPEHGHVYNDIFEFEVSDGIADARGRISLFVKNSPPIARNDYVTCVKNTFVDINVLANDSDPNGDQIRVKYATNSTHGGITTVLENNYIRYYPPKEFSGVDSFQYFIEDLQPNPADNLESNATVYISTRSNSAPKAVDDEFILSKGKPIDLNVLVNDYDPDGDFLRIIAVGVSQVGIAPKVVKIKNQAGQDIDHIQYVPFNDTYTDYFEYTISDGFLTSAAKVTINTINNPPIPIDDNTTVHWRSSTEINVLENDIDPNPGDKHILEVESVTHAQYGVVKLKPKSVVYTPKSNFTGIDWFTYRIKDAYDISTTAAKVTITVTNSAPVAVSDAYTQQMGTTKMYNILSNDYDPDNDPLFLVNLSQTPRIGKAVIINNMLQYTAIACGIDTLKYQISDGNLVSETTVTIEVKNRPPVAVNDKVYAKYGCDAIIQISSLLENDYHPDERDEIEFVGIDLNACTNHKFCNSFPKVLGHTVIVPFSPDGDEVDHFKYIIRTKGKPSFTASAKVTIRWTKKDCFKPVDVVFVLDGSILISKLNWNTMIEFTRSIIKKLPISRDKVHVGMVQYSDYARIEFGMLSNKRKIIKILDKLHLRQLKGASGTIFGLKKAVKLLNNVSCKRRSVQKVIVLITDGVSTRPTPCLKCKKSRRKSCCSICKFDFSFSDPWKFTKRINKWRKNDGIHKADWKIVSLGIGDELLNDEGYGWTHVQSFNFNPCRTKMVDWRYLKDIISDIVDTRCYCD